MLPQIERHRDQSALLNFPKTSYPLHAMTVSTGIERPKPMRYDWKGTDRGPMEWAVFQYTIEGAGELEYEGRRYALTPGKAFLLHFPHDHRYWLSKGGYWRIFYVAVSGSEVMRAWREAIGRLGPVITPEVNSPLLVAATSACLAVLDGDVNTAWRASSLAYDLATRLMEEALPIGDQPNRKDRPVAVMHALDFIRRRFRDPITIDEIAEAAGFSRHHFSRLFRRCEGIAPTEQLTRVRIREAMKLLQNTDWSVKKVSSKCGFRDPNYFAKVFRKAVGLSPGELRRSGMYGHGGSQQSYRSI